MITTLEAGRVTGSCYNAKTAPRDRGLPISAGREIKRRSAGRAIKRRKTIN